MSLEDSVHGLRLQVLHRAQVLGYWREVPFAMMGEGGLVEGAIDLVIEDTAGNVTVVDYKTDAVSQDLTG